jgi:N-acyl-D-aspartate/D-glutamate deacylase
VIRGGLVVDGTGPRRMPAATSPSTVTRWWRSGATSDRASSKIDAEGRIVTPGSSTSTPTSTPSSPGTPTAPRRAGTASRRSCIGNCGVTFAPVRPGSAAVLAEMMEHNTN